MFLKSRSNSVYSVHFNVMTHLDSQEDLFERGEQGRSACCPAGLAGKPGMRF